MFGKTRPWSRGMRLTAVIGGLVLAAGSAVGVGVAAGMGDSFAATGDSPEMASVQALLAKAPKPGSDKIGPFANDFIDIKKVQPNRNANAGGASGTFTEDCGTNQNNHHNSDNFIVTPGLDHGALHVHDYVGNRTTTARSNDRSLDAGGTTCANGDKSTYYWPVIRIKQEANGTKNNQQGPDKGNIGRLVEPTSATIKFTSGGAAKVAAAPKFLRSIMGDAKEVTNGAANAKATWTCTGFENRVTNKYPVCPQGAAVERIMQFPNCWDGKNTDSANHRTHIVFAKAGGQCPKGTKAVPQLEYDLVYQSVPNGSVFAVDGFDGQLHSPATDHADTELLMNAQQMGGVVGCINNGQKCVNNPQGGGQNNGGANNGGGGNNGGGNTGQPASNQHVTCPDVRQKMPAIPASVKSSVTQDLDQMDNFLTDANNRLQAAGSQATPDFVNNAILGSLQNNRQFLINQILNLFNQARAAQPQGNLVSMAGCSMVNN
ncbi:secreted protein [Kutzneria sp. 744]|nr:secreted protein [Kutzneria sp. 744]